MMKIFFICLLGIIAMPLKAQYYAVRTNAVGWATGTANIAIEASLSRKVSVDLPVYYNPLKTTYLNTEFIAVQPAIKIWRIKPHIGSYVAISGSWAMHDFGGNREKSVKGDLIGGGLSYGYSLPITKRMNIVAEAGLGAYHIHYKEFDYDVHYTEHEYIYIKRKWYILPSRVELAISYLF